MEKILELLSELWHHFCYFRITSVVDFDAGTREYPLTVQVSDGTNTIDITGTIVINGINEHATTFAGASE